MQIYPNDLFLQLEFDKILQDLSIRCCGQPGRARISSPVFLTDAITIRRELEKILCYQEILQDPERIRVQEYLDIAPLLGRLEITDHVLEIEELLEIRKQLATIQTWFHFFAKDKRVRWKPLFELLEQTEPLPSILHSFSKIMDEEGNIKNTASENLAQIRKEIQNRSAALDHVFNRVLLRCKEQGWLTDNFESYRNGRRVLAVLAEYKRKIRGIIHDESSTGKTVFIQPEETLALDSELFDLYNDERREIRKILRTLCNSLQEKLSVLRSGFNVIIELDTIQAKALQAIALGIQSMPRCTDSPGFEWFRAYHPLLLLKHKNNRKKVVPFSLRLDDKQRIIIISGPNAGGKSITLKTVGLLCLMHQNALLTPLDDHSTMGIWTQMLTDIGDQQSIEQDLSTYTSHLQNMKVFTEQSHRNTLFLIDEFGSGTDPATGAAIAESILMRLHQLEARGVITTHYGNLKLLASRTNGMENASMSFDKELLQPTFQLHVGTPGSSFAFEIAHRSGLSEKIIQRARQKAGKKEGQLEYLLTSLQQEKNEWDKKLAEIKIKEENLEKLMRNYERMTSELDVRRKKLKLQEKNQALQNQMEISQKMEKVIREIREKQNLEKAREIISETKEIKSQLKEETSMIKTELIKKIPGVEFKELRPGDMVRLKSGGMTGQITSIQKNKITIASGTMTFVVPPDEIEPARTPIEIKAQKSVNMAMQAEEVHHRLDIRGLRKEEALTLIERFVDKALVANLPFLEIIHGKGNGILKNLVRDKLKHYGIPMQISHPDPESGGDGVTLIKF